MVESESPPFVSRAVLLEARANSELNGTPVGLNALLNLGARPPPKTWGLRAISQIEVEMVRVTPTAIVNCSADRRMFRRVLSRLISRTQ